MHHAMHHAVHHAMHHAMHRVRRNAHPVKAGYSEAKTESIDAQRAQLSRSLAASMKANLLGAGVRSHPAPAAPAPLRAHALPCRAATVSQRMHTCTPPYLCTPRAGRRGAAVRGQGAQGGPGGHQGRAAPPGGGRALSGLLGPLGPAPPSRGGVRTEWGESARANASERARVREREPERARECGRQRERERAPASWLDVSKGTRKTCAACQWWGVGAQVKPSG